MVADGGSVCTDTYPGKFEPILRDARVVLAASRHSAVATLLLVLVNAVDDEQTYLAALREHKLTFGIFKISHDLEYAKHRLVLVLRDERARSRRDRRDDHLQGSPLSSSYSP